MLKEQKTFQESQICFPKGIKHMMLLCSQPSQWNNFGCCWTIHTNVKKWYAQKTFGCSTNLLSILPFSSYNFEVTFPNFTPPQQRQGYPFSTTFCTTLPQAMPYILTLRYSASIQQDWENKDFFYWEIFISIKNILVYLG